MALQLYKGNDALVDKTTFEVMPLAFQLADKLAATEFVPAALRNRPGAIAAAILTGHEVGLPPMASLAHIHVINGKPGLSAAAQRALILAHGHRIWVDEQSTTRVTVCGQRRGEDRVLSVTWTMDDAKRAGLLGNPSWQKYPRNMLIARSTGDVARGAFMDVLGGIPYNAEELEDLKDGEVVDVEEVPAAAPTTQRRKARQAATAPQVAIVEPPPAPPADPVEDAPERPPEEPPPAPEPEPEAVEPTPPPAPEPIRRPGQSFSQSAALAAPMEVLTLAQQVAMECRKAGIERLDLIFAVTGKTHARELTREEAVRVLESAKTIGRGEALFVKREPDDVWEVIPVDPSQPSLLEDGDS